jgi:predicted nucleic acid-binding protein
MRVALDTNVLGYAEGLGEPAKCRRAVELVESLMPSQVVVPAQVLGELMRVLVKKAALPPEAAREAIMGWADTFAVADSTWPDFQSAFDLVADHRFSLWDALIFSVAAQSRCRLLLSEDLHHGFTWRGVTVRNPFL